MVRIVGLGGSLRKDSNSLKALEVAMDAAEAAGARVELFDVRRLDLPMFTPGVDAPAAARNLAMAIETADAMIWSSPLYHGTVSGSFKNALDWLDLLARADPPYLTDKVIGLISTAGGVQGLQAINTMEFVVRALRGYAVPFVVPIAQADDRIDPMDPALAKQLQAFAGEVVSAAHRMAGKRAASPVRR